LPHGAYVKVSASGQLINLWIVPSPSDLYMTEGANTAVLIKQLSTVYNNISVIGQTVAFLSRYSLHKLKRET